MPNKLKLKSSMKTCKIIELTPKRKKKILSFSSSGSGMQKSEVKRYLE